jgi:hypothetical protein
MTKPFDHVGKLKRHMKRLLEHIALLNAYTEKIVPPQDLDEHDTYEEIQDAIIRIMENIRILQLAFIHLSKEE